MADVFSPYILRSYQGLFENTGPSFKFGTFKSHTFDRGTNVYVLTAITSSRASDSAVASNWGLVCNAWIDKWSIYGAAGQIIEVDVSPDPFRNIMFINDCANITFGVGASGGRCGTLATVFRR